MTDWQKGDLALCVRHVAPIKVGQIHTVVFVAPDRNTGIIALAFEGVEPANPEADCFLSNRFRKITPPRPTADDREVIDIMKGRKVPA
ncbi:MAG: hypothetical protein GOVbin7759_42 [Prokaryotic dsDNA virus sp.]|jgi:hypothetical protein|nr:MAG: hypothetical protein GOVbin7759_42 [Prokaryotic dsDNA virus sp.]